MQTPVDGHANAYTHLANIVQHSDDAIISKTMDGIITSWNLAAEKLFGYTAEESLGNRMLHMLPQGRQAEEEIISQRLAAGEKVSLYETQRVAKDGRVLDLSLTAFTIAGPNGEPAGIAKIIRDITNKKAIEKALRESQAKLKLALETGHIGTWSLDSVKGPINCSQEARQIYGLDSISDVTIEVLNNLAHPDDRDRLEQAWQAVFNGSQLNIEYRILPAKGAQKWVRTMGTPIGGPEQGYLPVTGTLLDITREKQTEEELLALVSLKTQALQQLNEELQRSNEDLEQFAYTASHDLQEPLRKIQVLASRAPRENEARPIIEKMSGVAARMGTLIKDILEYSRLQGIQGLYQPVNLNSVLESVKEDFNELMQSKTCHITSNQLPTVTGVTVQLKQLFANLLSNSLKFCEDAPQIAISWEPLVQGERNQFPELMESVEYGKIIFTDNGIGFAQEGAERLFKPFYRLNQREKYQGSGIGLALCQKIVRLHKGCIKAEGQPGKGAVFTVVLPLAQEAV